VKTSLRKAENMPCSMVENEALTHPKANAGDHWELC
jgi:hypothetical protein